MPTLKVVVLNRQLADVLVRRPLKLMKIHPRFRIDHLWRKSLRFGMLTVNEHETRPILAWILMLRLAVHLDRLSRPVIVVYRKHRFAFIDVMPYIRQVMANQKVAVKKHGPTLKLTQMRDEKPRKTKLGGR